MEDQLGAIRRAALDQAAKSGTLDDIEKAVSVAKALAETEKSASDTRNAHRQLRLQWIASLSSFLVPVVSLLALFATIYVQSQQLTETRQQNSAQLEATRQQNEDTQWRDFLTSLKRSADVFDSDVTVAPRLRSFFHSRRYGEQAREISVRLMGRLTNAPGFQDLYEIVFAEVNSEVFLKILDVGRSLRSTRVNIETECSNLSAQYKLSPRADFGLCTLTMPVSELTKAINSPFPPKALQLRQATSGVYDEAVFLSKQIAPYLKTNYPVGNNNHDMKELNLSNMDLFFADFSNIDFSKIKLANSVFTNINFEGAILGTDEYATIYLDASNWWDATSISQDWLDFLIKYQYPFWHFVEFGPLSAPTPEHYRARIAELCQPLRPVCKPENLRFGSPATRS